ncbi:MAG: hypothetical protein ACRENK_15610 [Gemmatimonadaceae bacterium]
MSHVRELMVEAIKTAVTGLPTVGSTNVFRDRVSPLQRTELPALVVRFPPATEDVAVDQFPAPRITDRLCRIQVAGVVATKDGFGSLLNQIGLEVEQALAMPIAGPWKHLTIRRVDFDLTGTAEQPTGEIAMTYEARYYVAENAPETAL